MRIEHLFVRSIGIRQVIFNSPKIEVWRYIKDVSGILPQNLLKHRSQPGHSVSGRLVMEDNSLAIQFDLILPAHLTPSLIRNISST